MVLLRIATAILHITASGLVGWGLACAWQQKSIQRFLLALLSATLVHGLWNSLAILYALVPGLADASLPNYVEGISSSMIIMVLSSLIIGLSFLLFGINRHLQKESLKVDTPIQSPPPQV